MKKKILVLLLIIFLAFFLRIYKFTSVPVSLNWDEAAIGYNAYSILKTGKDEWGKKLPLAFKSFGDYKSPLYIYLLVPFIFFFGLNEFTVRFPSVILGTLTVLLTYFLVNVILDKEKGNKNSLISLVAALLMAVSPWHLRFSRVAFEANLAIFLQTFSLVCLFKGFKEKKYLLLAPFSLAAATYAYHSVKFYMPILLIGFFIIYRKRISQHFKYYLIFAVILLILILPNIMLTLSPEGTSRGSGTLITNDAEKINQTNKLYSQDIKEGRKFFGINNNYSFYITRTFIYNYLKHFSPKFLFLGNIDVNWRLNLKNVGMMYYLDLFFILIGLYLFLKQKKQYQLFILFWFFTSPIISSLTIDSPHSLRSLNILPAPFILIGYGFVFFLEKIKEKKILFSLIMIVYIYNFLYFQYFYFQLYPVISEVDWQYPIKQVLNYAVNRENDYEKIIIFDSQTYIYYLFYTKYNPLKYQIIPDKDKKRKIGKYVFKKIDWRLDGNREGKKLIIDNQFKSHFGAKVEKIFYYQRQKPAFVAYEI